MSKGGVVKIELQSDEEKFLEESQRCICGHLVVLHNDHCCMFCMVPDCGCNWCYCEACTEV